MRLALVTGPTVEPISGDYASIISALPRKKITGIYAIRSVTTGKRYVGSAVWMQKRWRHHLEHLNAGRHHSAPLQNAWNKYGGSDFVFEILEIAPKEALIQAEQKYIDAFRASDRRCGYNVLPKAGSPLGNKRGEAFSQKMREIRAEWKPSAEMIARQRAAMRGNTHLLGHKHSEATLEKLRAARIGRKPALGMKHSDEFRAMISKLHKGKPLSAEHRAKIAAALRGRKKSVEVAQ